MKFGQVHRVPLRKKCLARIDEIDQKGPAINAIILLCCSFVAQADLHLLMNATAPGGT